MNRLEQNELINRLSVLAEHLRCNIEDWHEFNETMDSEWTLRAFECLKSQVDSLHFDIVHIEKLNKEEKNKESED